MINLTTTNEKLSAALETADKLSVPPPQGIAGSLAEFLPGTEAALERGAERALAADRFLRVMQAIDRNDKWRPLARAVEIGSRVAAVVGANDVKSLRSLVEGWKRHGRLSAEHNYASLRRCYNVAQATELHDAPFKEGLTLSSAMLLAEPKNRKQPGLLSAVAEAIRDANRLPIQHARVMQIIRDSANEPSKRKARVQPAPLPATLADLPDNVIPLAAARKARVLNTLTRADFENVSGALLMFIKAGDPKAIAMARALAAAIPQAA